LSEIGFQGQQLVAIIDPRKLTAAIDQLGSLGESGFEPEID
jgi:hypothetical protein